jgi:hypothetical protein
MTMRNATPPSIEHLVPGFTPENDLELRAIRQPELLRGLAWGAPRWGHPEGRVGEHVAQILGSIAADAHFRAELRFIALVHDSFKYRVRPHAKYTPDNDHAVLARRFAQRLISEQRILATIELHDEPYYIWHNQGGSVDALTPLLARIPDPDLFLSFVELDASTEGKDPSLLFWLRYELAVGKRIPPLAPLAAPSPRARGEETQTVYIHVLETYPENQNEIAEAVLAVADAFDPDRAMRPEVLQSDDGIRVLLITRWCGASTRRLLREGKIVERALRDHPVLARATPREAHLYHGMRLTSESRPGAESR